MLTYTLVRGIGVEVLIRAVYDVPEGMAEWERASTNPDRLGWMFRLHPRPRVRAFPHWVCRPGSDESGLFP